MSLSPLYKRTLQFTDLNDQAKLFRYLIFCDFLFYYVINLYIP